MAKTGRVEGWLGLAAGAYGVVVTAIVTALIQQTGGAPCGPPATTCVAGVDSVTVFFLVAFASLFLLAATGAALHGFRGSAAGAALLWTSAVALAFLTFLGMFSIGPVMLPGTLTLFGVALIAWVRLIEQRLGWQRWIEILAGAGSGVLAVAAMVALFFLPSIEYNGPNYGGTFSIAGLYGLAGVLPIVLPVVAFAYLIAGGAMAHAARDSRAGYALLSIATAVFIGLVVVGFLVPDTTYYLRSVAQYLAPSAALAVIAVAVASTHLRAAPVVAASGA